MKGIAVCLRGGFDGMPAHLAALDVWIRASEENGFPLPELICTSSAGGIAGAIALQNAEARKRAQLMMINLRKSQFARLNPKIRNRGLATIASTLGLLVPAQVIRNRNIRFLATVAATSAAFWAQREFVRSLFHTDSFLTYDKLYNLLMGTLNFDEIFASPIKIEIPCVNLNKAGWTLDEILSDPPRYLDGWQNKGWESVSNFKEEDINLPIAERNHRFGAGIVHGARICALFRPGRNVEGDALVDTAFLDNIPFSRAIKQGYSKIVIFYYNRSVEAPSDQPIETWVQNLTRSMDIVISEKTRTVIVGSLRTNNDLEQMQRQKESLSTLEHLLQSCRIDSPAQQVIRKHIQTIKQSMECLSYSRKRIIKLLFVRSPRPLPHIHFGGFTQSDMIESLNCGAEAMRDAMPQIQKLYDED